MSFHNSAIVTAKSTKKFDLVTFRQFAALALRRGWTVEDLAARFRGRIERPTEFFSRVLSRKWPDNLVVYRSVLEFFGSSQVKATNESRPGCACGCDRAVFDRKRYATPGCKKRAARQCVRDMQNRGQEVLDFIDARRGQKPGIATLPLTGRRRALRAV